MVSVDEYPRPVQRGGPGTRDDLVLVVGQALDELVLGAEAPPSAVFVQGVLGGGSGPVHGSVEVVRRLFGADGGQDRGWGDPEGCFYRPRQRRRLELRVPSGKDFENDGGDGKPGKGPLDTTFQRVRAVRFDFVLR